MNEAICIAILFAASLLTYALVRKYAGIMLHPFGMILIWPFVLAFVMGYSDMTKYASIGLLLPAAYLLVRGARKRRKS